MGSCLSNSIHPNHPITTGQFIQQLHLLLHQRELEYDSKQNQLLTLIQSLQANINKFSTEYADKQTVLDSLKQSEQQLIHYQTLLNRSEKSINTLQLSLTAVQAELINIKEQFKLQSNYITELKSNIASSNLSHTATVNGLQSEIQLLQAKLTNNTTVLNSELTQSAAAIEELKLKQQKLFKQAVQQQLMHSIELVTNTNNNGSVAAGTVNKIPALSAVVAAVVNSNKSEQQQQPNNTISPRLNTPELISQSNRSQSVSSQSQYKSQSNQSTPQQQQPKLWSLVKTAQKSQQQQQYQNSPLYQSQQLQPVQSHSPLIQLDSQLINRIPSPTVLEQSIHQPQSQPQRAQTPIQNHIQQHQQLQQQQQQQQSIHPVQSNLINRIIHSGSIRNNVKTPLSTVSTTINGSISHNNNTNNSIQSNGSINNNSNSNLSSNNNSPILIKQNIITTNNNNAEAEFENWMAQESESESESESPVEHKQQQPHPNPQQFYINQPINIRSTTAKIRHH